MFNLLHFEDFIFLDPHGKKGGKSKAERDKDYTDTVSQWHKAHKWGNGRR